MMNKYRTLLNFIIQPIAKNTNGASYNSILKHQSKRFNSSSVNRNSKPRVVVLGAGWSSIYFIKYLSPKQFDLTVVSPRNYFTFTPLLPKIMSGMASSNTASEPFLTFLKKYFKNNSIFVHATCVDVDTKSNSITCAPVDQSGPLFSLSYDYLVIGVGSRSNTFGINGVEKYAYFLKEIEHAETIFQKVLNNFRMASMPFVSDDDRRRLLHFVVVGGGPTGVESTGELAVLFNKYLLKSYPTLKEFVKVSIVEGGNRLLPTLTNKSSNYVAKVFKKCNINTYFGKVVCEVKPESCVLKELSTGKTEEIQCGLVLWASGLKETELASKLQKKLNLPEKSRALIVDQYLRLKGSHNVFCLGDCCRLTPTKLSDNADAILEKIGSPTIRSLVKNRRALSKEYPQLSIYKWSPRSAKFKSGVSDILSKLGGESKESFVEILKLIDSSFAPPFPTAQNAKQEAIYLSKMFNNGSVLSGQFKDMAFCEVWKGTLASLGGYKVVMNTPIFNLNGGFLAFSFWNTIYLLLFTSCKMRALFLFDLLMSFFSNRHLICKSYKP